MLLYFFYFNIFRSLSSVPLKYEVYNYIEINNIIARFVYNFEFLIYFEIDMYI